MWTIIFSWIVSTWKLFLLRLKCWHTVFILVGFFSRAFKKKISRGATLIPSTNLLRVGGTWHGAQHTPAVPLLKTFSSFSISSWQHSFFLRNVSEQKAYGKVSASNSEHARQTDLTLKRRTTANWLLHGKNNYFQPNYLNTALTHHF